MKSIKIAVIAASVMLLAGCGNKSMTNSDQTNQAEQNAPTSGTVSPSGAVSPVKVAMESGKAMKCEYTMSNGFGSDVASITYVEGNKYQTTGKVADSVQHSSFDGATLYMWTEGQKNGVKITADCSKELVDDFLQKNPGAATPDPTGVSSLAGIVDAKCAPADNIDFSIPSDVIFTDQCQAMKDSAGDASNDVSAPAAPEVQE